MTYQPPKFRSGTIAQYFSGANRQTSIAVLDERKEISPRRVRWMAIVFVPALYFVRNAFMARDGEGEVGRFRAAMCESIALLLFIAKVWEYQVARKLPGSGRPPVTAADLDRYAGI